MCFFAPNTMVSLPSLYRVGKGFKMPTKAEKKAVTGPWQTLISFFSSKTPLYVFFCAEYSGGGHESLRPREVGENAVQRSKTQNLDFEMPKKSFRHFFKNPFQLSFHVRGRPSPMALVSIFSDTVTSQRSRKRLEVARKSLIFRGVESVSRLTFSRWLQRCHSRCSPRSAKGSKWPPKLKKGP